MNKDVFHDRVTTELKKISGVETPSYKMEPNTDVTNTAQYVVDCHQYRLMDGHVDNELARVIEVEKEKIGNQRLVTVIDTDILTLSTELYELIKLLIENGADTIHLVSKEAVHPESVAVVALAITGSKRQNIGLIIPDDDCRIKNIMLVENILGEGFVANSNLFNIDDNGAFLSVIKNISMMPSQNKTVERLGL